jgi:hypothetical protein
MIKCGDDMQYMQAPQQESDKVNSKQKQGDNSTKPQPHLRSYYGNDDAP